MGIQNIAAQEPADVRDIEGLSYIPNVIDEQTEQRLISIIDTQPWLADLKRRVQHYGWRYDYKARTVTSELKLGPLPDWLTSLATQFHTCGLLPKIPDQVIINEYQPGQGISAHVDCVPCFEETIASLSLSSSCIMEFTHTRTQQKILLLVEPRSLIVLSGDARYHWQHSIPSRKTDRYNGEVIQRARRLSLTFRNVISFI